MFNGNLQIIYKLSLYFEVLDVVQVILSFIFNSHAFLILFFIQMISLIKLNKQFLSFTTCPYCN